MKITNISQVAQKGLCLGCGVCQDICPQKCVTINHGYTNIPMVNDGGCVDCSKCLKVCAGIGIDLENRSKALFETDFSHYHQEIGRYLKCYSGYSNSFDIRYHSASGGCVSQFLIWLLEQGIIDGAIVTSFKKSDPMRPQPLIARTKDEILSGRSSKYCVVSFDGIISEILKTPGRYVLVGLPCHIQAFRKVLDVCHQIKERVIGYFSIYCSTNKNILSQDYLLYRYHVDKGRLDSFTYRDEGCPGSMYFRDKNGDTIVPPIDYMSYYFGLRSFFSMPRCSLCNDYYGELADVCFGDLDHGPYREDKIGVNSIVTRSKHWDGLINRCKEEGCLELDEISEETLLSAQRCCGKGKKGEGFYASMKMRIIFGQSVPEYDNLLPITPGWKALLKTFVTKTARYIGNHRHLWFIIKFLDKDKRK